MSVVKDPDRLTVEEYLDSEAASPVKHEYLAGVSDAMAGASNRHNDIAGNAFAAWHQQLKGQKCRPSNSNTKVRIDLPGVTRFYHPDAHVACHRNDADDSYQEKPVVILEVLSESTRRTDTGEKVEAYLRIPSLCVYLIAEQEKPGVKVYRRQQDGGGEDFAEEYYASLADTIPLPEIGASLALADLYDQVEFSTAKTAD